MIEIGRISEIVSYPVKSMAGTAAESAFLGWHGIDGDRRFAVRRAEDRSAFPWLTAGRLPALVLYQPRAVRQSADGPLSMYVRTPSGKDLELLSRELQEELTELWGSEVELMNLKHGVFDEAAISVISRTTIAAIGQEAGVDLDRRRFRANLLLETPEGAPFHEDAWVGGQLVFGDSDERPAVSVTLRDERCAMVNLDPDTAKQDARVMKAVVRLNQNTAGVYATVVRTGTIRVGDRVHFVANGSAPA